MNSSNTASRPRFGRHDGYRIHVLRRTWGGDHSESSVRKSCYGASSWSLSLAGVIDQGSRSASQSRALRRALAAVLAWEHFKQLALHLGKGQEEQRKCWLAGHVGPILCHPPICEEWTKFSVCAAHRSKSTGFSKFCPMSQGVRRLKAGTHLSVQKRVPTH